MGGWWDGEGWCGGWGICFCCVRMTWGFFFILADIVGVLFYVVVWDWRGLCGGVGFATSYKKIYFFFSLYQLIFSS